MVKVEMVDCFILTIDQDMGKDLISRFMEYNLGNGIYPLSKGGTAGPRYYCFCHRLGDREKIKGFFRDNGIEVGEFTA